MSGPCSFQWQAGRYLLFVMDSRHAKRCLHQILTVVSLSGSELVPCFLPFWYLLPCAVKCLCHTHLPPRTGPLCRISFTRMNRKFLKLWARINMFFLLKSFYQVGRSQVHRNKSYGEQLWRNCHGRCNWFDQIHLVNGTIDSRLDNIVSFLHFLDSMGMLC